MNKISQSYMKDFEIKIEDADLRKDLAKILCEEIDNSIKENEASYSLFRRCEYQYRGLSKYKQVGKTKNAPWIDASDFWTPLTEWIICAIAARVDSMLFSVEPIMTAMAVESSDVQGEDGVTDFCDMIMTKIVELREKFKFYIKQKIKQPLSVAAYEWEYQEDKVQGVEKGVMQEDFSVLLNDGQTIPAEELPDDIQDAIKKGQMMPGEEGYYYVQQDKPIQNNPEFRYISPADYVWSSNTKKGEKPFLEGYRFWQTIGEVVSKQKSEEYWDYEEIQDALRKTIDEKHTSGDRVKQSISERSHQYECFKICTRLPFNKKGDIDLTDKDAVEQEVIAEVAKKEQVLLKLNKWHYLRHPAKRRFFLYGWYEEKDTILDDSPFIGRSVSEKIVEINQLMNKEFQQIVDNADLAMAKIFTKRRMLNDEDYEEPSVFPGAIWEVEEQGDIQVLEVGDVKRIGFQIMDQLQDFAVRLTNISSLNVASRMEGGKPLATEVVNILKEGEVGREGFVQSCHKDLRQIYQWTTDYYFQFMPPNLERRIRGENQQMIFPESPNEEQFRDPESGMLNQEAYDQASEEFEKQRFYSREMLVGVGKWDFKWNGTQLSGDREWQLQTADYLLNIFGQFLGGKFVTMTGVWEGLRDVLISRGKKDWQKYLAPREIFEQMDNQMLAMQQLSANLPNIQQNMIDQGMDPAMVEKVIGKIQEKIAGGGQGGTPEQAGAGAGAGKKPA